MYINEATNNLIKKGERRLGRVKIEKHVSLSKICQDGLVSSDKIIVMSDDLSSSSPAELNYVGKKKDIEDTGGVVTDAPFGDC